MGYWMYNAETGQVSISIVRDDFITMLAPSTRVNFGCMTTKAREKEPTLLCNKWIDFAGYPTLRT